MSAALPLSYCTVVAQTGIEPAPFGLNHVVSPAFTAFGKETRQREWKGRTDAEASFALPLSYGCAYARPAGFEPATNVVLSGIRRKRVFVTPKVVRRCSCSTPELQPRKSGAGETRTRDHVISICSPTGIRHKNWRDGTRLCRDVEIELFRQSETWLRTRTFAHCAMLLPCSPDGHSRRKLY